MRHDRVIHVLPLSFSGSAPDMQIIQISKTINKRILIIITVEDVDGDTIRCRWAEAGQGECGGVCNAFPNAVLDIVWLDSLIVQCGYVLYNIGCLYTLLPC